MTQRAAVLGAAGFIGSHLTAYLKDRGWHVTATDRVHRPDRRHLYGQADRTALQDLRDPQAALNAIQGADLVFHLAADHGGAGYFHSEHDYPAALNNARIDTSVLHACAQTQARLFYAGSFCAYPTELQGQHTRLHEALLPAGEPEQLYGLIKRATTLFTEQAPFDARAGIFATIYGPGQEHEGIRAKFPTAITRRAIQARAHPGPIELWGDGTQIRTFLFIADALDRIYQVATTPGYWGPVNIASDEEVTVLQCAQWACKLAGIPPDFDFRADKPTGVPVRIPENAKFAEHYDLAPETPWRDGFGALYDWLEPILTPAKAAIA